MQSLTSSRSQVKCQGLFSPSKNYLAAPVAWARPLGKTSGVELRLNIKTRSSSYEEAYKQIRERRIARKQAKESEKAKEEAGESDNGENLVVQEGDDVTFAWEARSCATGDIVDRTTPIFGNTQRKGQPETPVEVQVGDGPGFAPKQGLRLAFSKLAKRTRVGDVLYVYCRPKGSGWFRSYDIFSERGVFLTTLSAEEKICGWAESDTVFSLQVIKIKPPPGNRRRTEV